MTATKRRFSREFELEAARSVADRAVSVRQAAQYLNIDENVLRKWVREKPENALLLGSCDHTLRRNRHLFRAKVLLDLIAGFSRPGNQWYQEPLQHEFTHSPVSLYRTENAAGDQEFGTAFEGRCQGLQRHRDPARSRRSPSGRLEP
jgi:hypothetical protein